MMVITESKVIAMLIKHSVNEPSMLFDQMSAGWPLRVRKRNVKKKQKETNLGEQEHKKNEYEMR